MKKLKVFIGWFLALNGITKYYPDPQTGYLQRSRYLQIYSIVHSVLTVCGLPCLFLDTVSDNPVVIHRLTSNWMLYGSWLYISLQSMVILSTIYSAHFMQPSIQRMILKLERLDEIELPSSAQRYVCSLLYRKLYLLCLQFVLIMSFNYTRFDRLMSHKWFCVLYKMWTDIMSTAISLQLYDILWKIYVCGLKLQFQLETMLRRRAKIKEFLRFYKKQQSLIDICQEFCKTFGHPMLWYPVNILCTSVICGYFLIRILVVAPHLGMTMFTLLIFVIYSFAEFYVSNNMSSTVAELIPNTIAVLRQSQPQDHRVERAISWMSLQLSCQSTEIHVFGMVTLNQRLTFIFITQIFLNTHYMIQNDYNLFM